MAGHVTFHCRVSGDRLCLDVEVIRLDQDYCVLLTGGSSHVGAIATCYPDARVFCMTLPSHREDVVARAVASRIAKIACCKVTVVCGIHLDHITKQEIQSVIAACDAAAEEIARWIREDSEKLY